jgi:hypothetical protein
VKPKGWTRAGRGLDKTIFQHLADLSFDERLFRLGGAVVLLLNGRRIPSVDPVFDKVIAGQGFTFVVSHILVVRY